MTKHGHGRQLVTVRLSKEGLAAIDERAERHKLTRSEMIRAMLAFALRRMPPPAQIDSKGKK